MDFDIQIPKIINFEIKVNDYVTFLENETATHM